MALLFDWLTGSGAQIIFVFILLFTLIFGILQKIKLFGENKKQIDALISLAAALLTTSVAYALDVIRQLVPFMAVGLVIILVFVLLIGMFWHDKDGFKPADWMKYMVFGIVFIALVIAVMYFTGAWSYLGEIWRDESSNAIGNIVTALIVIGVIVLVFFGAEKSQ